MIASILCLAVAVSPAAYWLDITGLDYEEQVTALCLQGIVNRDAPRLFLDTYSVYWQWPPSDRHWRAHLQRTKGYRFTELPSLAAAIAKFRGDIRGLALYDPTVADAQRSLACTLASLNNCLPVTPAMLQYRSAGMSDGLFALDDCRSAGRWQARDVKLAVDKRGLRITCANSRGPFGSAVRFVRFDPRRFPLLRITVASCNGRWALKLNQGTAADIPLQRDTSRLGAFTYDLTSAIKDPLRPTKLLVYVVGRGKSVVVGRIEVLDRTRRPAQPRKPVRCFDGLTVKHDLRRFTDDMTAYRWALEHLVPQTTRSIFYNLGHSFKGVHLGADPAVHLSLDYVVSRGGLVVNLSPVESGPGRPWQPHPEQAKLFGRLVRDLGPLTQVWGWAEPEGLFARLVSSAGGMIMCPGPNLSFWRHVPASSWRLPSPPRKHKRLEAKYYVVFETNEGDTPKIVCSFFAGGWLCKERGSVPVAWGINPMLGTLFPALLEYYASTATGNDSFFCGVSGAGYCFPDLLPDPEGYYRWTERHAVAADVRFADVWVVSRDKQLSVMRAYHEAAPSLRGFTSPWPVDGLNAWLPDATPVIASAAGLHYFRLDKEGAAGLARKIRAVAQRNGKPFFIGVYGGVGRGLFSLIRKVMRLLGPDYEAVTMDDFIALASEAGKFELRVEPRFVGPGESINATLIWRGLKAFAAPAAVVEVFGRSATVRVTWNTPQPPPPKQVKASASFKVPPDAKAGAHRIIAHSARRSRSATVFVANRVETISDFSGRGKWRDQTARLSVENGLGRVLCPQDKPYAHIRCNVTVDLDRESVLEIVVSKVEGRWALKANDGTLFPDRYLVRDTESVGTFFVRLDERLRPWRGRKSFDLILFSCGAGCSVWADRVRVLYLR